MSTTWPKRRKSKSSQKGNLLRTLHMQVNRYAVDEIGLHRLHEWVHLNLQEAKRGRQTKTAKILEEVKRDMDNFASGTMVKSVFIDKVRSYI